MFPCFPTRKGLTCPKEQVTQYSSFFKGVWVGKGVWGGEEEGIRKFDLNIYLS